MVNSTNLARPVGSTRPDQILEREALPRDHHAPGLDTAVPVDPLLEFVRLDQVVELVAARLVNLPFDLHRPGTGSEVLGIRRRVIFARPELVEIVVAGNRLIGRERIIISCEPSRRLPGQALCQGGPFTYGKQNASPRQAGQEGAPIHIQPLLSSVGGLEVGSAADQHEDPLEQVALGQRYPQDTSRKGRWFPDGRMGIGGRADGTGDVHGRTGTIRLYRPLVRLSARPL